MAEQYDVVWNGAARDYLNVHAEILRPAPRLAYHHERVRPKAPIAVVVSNEWITVTEVIARTQLNKHKVRDELAKMLATGKIERTRMTTDRTRCIYYRLAQKRVP